MLYINIIVIGLLILQDFLLWLLSTYRWIDHTAGKKIVNWPLVTILVPARNEEIYLAACLQSLERLDYPESRLQLIIGDDQSSDNTAYIIKEWATKGNNRVFVAVHSTQSKQINGKANALSQMARLAKGELLLFTDADCTVNPAWVKEMVSAYRVAGGLVTGITAVRTPSLFPAMQSLDWWLTLGMIKCTSDLLGSVTAMGNNMLVGKEAYLEVGGFENVPFSVTEDFALAQALIEKGFRPVHQVSSRSLVMTKAERSFAELLKQRKRWMKGAMALPWYWILLLALQCGFFPAIIYLLTYNAYWGMGIWLVKIVIQSLFIDGFAGRAGIKVASLHLLLFEFYYLMVSWCTIVYYFWPSSINWKERHYR
jgi:cellulose synthase/poly-beta-1,6-N-acetylglucosamine synthase-like glycosyltransferase